uniref:NADH-ubiquinone oxidoreductase chain 2 n=1 Tax=Platerodrilus sp. MNCN/DNA:86739 TaxID=1905348 RepID=A0A342Z5E7_9COLE|nr:NADH dehydrogenase subunit 2 [Platerodrilus sp. MNCN/DNA:86739]
MKKLFKILFVITLISSSMISISSNNWLGMWMGMEINLLSIIPLMQKSMNKMSAESSIKYFITQTLASSILITTMMFTMMISGTTSGTENSFLNMIMISALLMKMGMAPFHFWFTEIMEGLSWMNCMIMMTWQKLTPMVFVMYNMIFPMFSEIIIIIGTIISSVMSFNQTSMRKLLTFSSINHMSWMMSSMMMSQTIWMYYFLVYSLLTINITWMMMKFKISMISQMNSNNLFYPMKMLFLLNMMNLGGLPPLLGFLPKWMTIEMLMNKNMLFLSLLMLITSTMMIFIYLKIMLSSILMGKSATNWKLKPIKIKSFLISKYNITNLLTLTTMTLMFNNS